MKFLAVLVTLAFATVTTAEPIRRSDPGCNDNTTCVCNVVQSQFCGDESINPACTNGHIFECNGVTGHTCDYGFSKPCTECGKVRC